MDESILESESFATFIQGFALISTIGFFLAGSITCLKIHQQKSVKNVNFLPYLMTCLNTFLWTVYGLLAHDKLLIAVNGIGCFLQCIYIFIFLQNCDKKKEYTKQVFILVAVSMFVMFISEFGTSYMDTMNALGWLACSVTILMFASPLSTVREVIRTQNSETISFPLSLMTCLVAGTWFIYGSLKHDSFIQVPNILGFFLGLTQISVIFTMKKTRTVTSKSII